MSSQQVNPLIQSILDAGLPTQAGVEKLLGVALKPGQENPLWKFYIVELPGGPFQGGELRLANSGDRALLSLQPREALGLTENDLDLKPWGQAIHIDINPQIPPEGTDAYSYAVKGARLSFQFTHVTRKLRTVSIEWGAKK